MTHKIMCINQKTQSFFLKTEFLEIMALFNNPDFSE